MAEYTFNCSAGALIRGQVRRQLKAYCWERGYKLELDEDKGFIESLFRVRIILPDSDFNKVANDLANWVNNYNR